MGKFYETACSIWGEEEVEKKINSKGIFTNVLFEQEKLQIALYVQDGLIPLYELCLSKKGASRIIIPIDYTIKEALKMASEFGATILIWDDGIDVCQTFKIHSCVANEVSMNKGTIGFVTSGTTGYPKIVLKDEDILINEGKMVSKDLGIEKFKSIIINVKQSHSYGYLYGVVIPFLHRVNVNMMSLFSVKLSKNIEQSLIITSPASVKKILNTIDSDSILSIVSAGKELTGINELLRSGKIKLFDQYGTTETGVIWINKFYNHENDVNVIEQSLFGNIIKYEDVYFKSSHTMIGYIKNKEIDFQNKIKLADIIERDSGIYKIIGRKDNVINKNGEKFSPERIESIIEEYTEIDHCLVLLNKKGILVCKYVSNKLVNVPSIVEILRKNVVSYAIPKVYEKVEEKSIISNNGKKIRYFREEM